MTPSTEYNALTLTLSRFAGEGTRVVRFARSSPLYREAGEGEGAWAAARTKWYCGRSALLAGVLLLVGFANGSSATETAVDQKRLDAARARAEQRWIEAQFNQLPIAFDQARADREMAAYSGSIVAFVADALLEANPSHEDAVMDYVNGDIVPFVVSHKESYLCLLTEHYYNLRASAAEIKDIQEPGETWIFEIAYVLVNTDAAREKARIATPGGDYSAVLSGARRAVKQYGWRGMIMGNEDKVRLGCTNEPVS